jgi:hypothetical protein
MEICKKCHKRDEKVIKCGMTIDDHIKWVRGYVGYCDICGKSVESTYYCEYYDKLVEKTSKEK